MTGSTMRIGCRRIGAPRRQRTGTAVGIALETLEPDDPRGSLQAWDPVSQKRGLGSLLTHRVESGHVNDGWRLGISRQSGGRVRCLPRRNRRSALESAAGSRYLCTAHHLRYRWSAICCVACRLGVGVCTRRPERSPSWVGVTGRRPGGWLCSRCRAKPICPELQPPTVPQPIAAPDFVVDESLAMRGQGAFVQCGYCHGCLRRNRGRF